ncbi:uncharacterized protein LOC115883058 [Sitophilus oryzae]|uniref:Uncharacterized protein LOC115883058 n=1 Tax=Sitophilus oryzae TaxID=7048 RepID=A0A6J2Y2P3_SITOR|nr:uncharacterized protein LOC115883058 [Sitophilus oryzae]
MSPYVVFLLIFAIAFGEQNEDPSVQNKDAKMERKIKGIAKNIVDKWKTEGLTITKDKVQEWIGKLDEGQAIARKEALMNNAQDEEVTVEEDTEQLDANTMEEVRKNVVETFSKIGKIKCDDCDGKNSEQSVNYNNLDVDELKRMQEQVKQFQQVEKMSKLAKVMKGLSNFDVFKKIIDLGPSLKNLINPKEDREEL